MDDFQAGFADTLAAITANLVAEPDVTTVLSSVTQACVDELGAASSGILLVDPRGGVEVAAATDEHAALLELLQSLTEHGPCVDCIRENTIISEFDLPNAASRWPQFAPAAVSAGYQAVIAIPMRLHTAAVGGLNLLYTDPPASHPPPGLGRASSLAAALADLAVLALVSERGPRRDDRLLEHTLGALNDRAHLFQAAGMVVGASDLNAHQAIRALRAYAQHTQRPLHEVVTAITDHQLDPRQIAQNTHTVSTDQDT